MLPELKANRPANVTLTGFLPDTAYAGLLTSADAVMTLTTRDHTMLRAAYEAIYQGTPVIVSDWPLLRSAFDEGAVHVANTSSAIAEGIRKMKLDHAAYRAGAVRLRERKLKRWTTTLAELRATVAAKKREDEFDPVARKSVASFDQSSDPHFLAYYEEASLSEATLQRFRNIRNKSLALLAAHGHDVAHLRVADIGCGAGTQSLLWAELGHSVLGLDVNAPLVEVAQRVLQNADFRSTSGSDGNGVAA